jgi:outer membrane receptor for ferrienterochelin and colicin
MVIDGHVYTSASASFPTVNPAQIERVEVLKGTEAAARFGPEAGTLGVVIVTMRHARSASTRPAP